MGTQENKEFIRKYLDALNGKPKPEETLDLYVNEQPLKDHIAMSEAAFPHYSIHIEKMVAEGDLVSVIGRIQGTNTGSFMGNPPTGKSIDILLHVTYLVVGNKIVDHWMLADNAALMQQLGLIPSAAD